MLGDLFKGNIKASLPTHCVTFETLLHILDKD